MDDYTLALILRGNFLLDHRVEGTEESRMSDEKMGFAAEMVEHARHLNGYIACAHESDAFGELFEIEEAIGGYTKLGPGVFGNIGMAACGE